MFKPKTPISGRLENSSGAWIRTKDLRVMSPTSYHCSTPHQDLHFRTLTPLCQGNWLKFLKVSNIFTFLWGWCGGFVRVTLLNHPITDDWSTMRVTCGGSAVDRKAVITPKITVRTS
jgi:hypothetical protein